MDTASRTARPVTIRLVLVTTPRVWHSRMPRLTPAEAPKSSALTIRYLSTSLAAPSAAWLRWKPDFYAEGVASQSPGSRSAPRGTDRPHQALPRRGCINRTAGVMQSLRGNPLRGGRSPGCAARPRALRYNAFGVNDRPGLWSATPERVQQNNAPSRRRSQVEDDQVVVREHRGEALSQVVAEAPVVVQPPERRPADDQELAAGPPQPLELAQRVRVVVGRPPVLAVPLRERQAAARHGKLMGLPLALVGQDAGGPRRQCGVHRLQRVVDATQPLQPPPRPARLRRVHGDAQGTTLPFDGLHAVFEPPPQDLQLFAGAAEQAVVVAVDAVQPQ